MEVLVCMLLQQKNKCPTGPVENPVLCFPTHVYKDVPDPLHAKTAVKEVENFKEVSESYPSSSIQKHLDSDVVTTVFRCYQMTYIREMAIKVSKTEMFSSAARWERLLVN